MRRGVWGDRFGGCGELVGTGSALTLITVRRAVQDGGAAALRGGQRGRRRGGDRYGGHHRHLRRPLPRRLPPQVRQPRRAGRMFQFDSRKHALASRTGRRASQRVHTLCCRPSLAIVRISCISCPCDGMCAGSAGCVARLAPPGLVGRRQLCYTHAQHGLQPALPGRRAWQRAPKPRCARCGRTAALGADRSSYKVDVAVVYVAQTNGLIKKAIERGALLRQLRTVTGAARPCLPFTGRQRAAAVWSSVLSAVQQGAWSPCACTWGDGCTPCRACMGGRRVWFGWHIIHRAWTRGRGPWHARCDPLVLMRARPPRAGSNSGLQKNFQVIEEALGGFEKVSPAGSGGGGGAAGDGARPARALVPRPELGAEGLCVTGPKGYRHALRAALLPSCKVLRVHTARCNTGTCKRSTGLL
jgi:hypothetical protein